MRALYFLIFFSLLSFQVKAQTVKVTGEVIDNNHQPMMYCNVAFKSIQDSKLIAGTAADVNGKWSIKIPKGNYWLEVSYIGYDTYRKQIEVKESTDVPVITLAESVNALQEFVVTARRKQRTPDSDVYFLAESSKVIGRSVLDVVSLSAGVSVDNTKGLKIYGKDGVRVRINDRQINLTGTQLTNFLSNLRGEDIQTVEVMALADASQMADATGGLIKIKLKTQANGLEDVADEDTTLYVVKKVVKVLNAYEVNVGIEGVAYENDFLGVRPNMSFNAKIDKLNLYGNLHYSSIGNREMDTEKADYLFLDNQLNTDSNVNLKRKQDDWFYRLGAIYQIDKKQSFGIDVDGLISSRRERINTPSIVNYTDAKKQYNSNYYSPETLKNFNFSLNYRRMINDLGSNLSIGADCYLSSDHCDEDNVLYSNDKEEDYEAKTSGATNYNQKMYTFGTDYQWVLSPILTFNMGAKLNYSRMKDKLNYNLMKDGSWTQDTDNTDNYKYDEWIVAGYGNAKWQVGKFDLMAGVRYEGTIKDTKSEFFPDRAEKRTYNDFFPVLSSTYYINKEKGHSITFKYKAGIKRPSFSQLLPFSTQQNLFTYIVGNPFLKPAYTYTIGADLLLFSGLYIGFDYTKDKDIVEQVMQQKEKDSPIVIAQYQNIPRADSYMMVGYIPIPINKNFYAGIEWTGGKKKRKYDNVNYKLWQAYVALEAQLTIAHDWYIEFYGSYVNRDFYGNMVLQDYYPIDLSLKRTFMNKKLQISLSGKNIFGKKMYIKTRGGSIDRDLYMKVSDKCSLFTLSLSYTFGGKNKVKAERVKAVNTEERER